MDSLQQRWRQLTDRVRATVREQVEKARGVRVKTPKQMASADAAPAATASENSETTVIAPSPFALEGAPAAAPPGPPPRPRAPGATGSRPGAPRATGAHAATELSRGAAQPAPMPRPAATRAHTPRPNAPRPNAPVPVAPRPGTARPPTLQMPQAPMQMPQAPGQMPQAPGQNLAPLEAPPQNGGVSVAAAFPASGDEPASSSIAAPYADRVLRVRAAGFGRRALACAVDALLMVGITTVVTFALGVFLGGPLPNLREIGPDMLVAGLLDRNPLMVGALGLLGGVTVLYQLYYGGILGQTIGMKLVGLRLISSRGTRPGVVRGVIRVLAFAVSVLPGGLGWLWAMFDREHRAVHDHLSGTYLIEDG